MCVCDASDPSGPDAEAPPSDIVAPRTGWRSGPRCAGGASARWRPAC
jgi:hypothetical protein